MSCKKCGSPFHEQWACTKWMAVRKGVQSFQQDTGAREAETRSLQAGTQAPPVDTKIVGKRRGRPQTITDMKAYRAAKAVEYRARKKADEHR